MVRFGAAKGRRSQPGPPSMEDPRARSSPWPPALFDKNVRSAARAVLSNNVSPRRAIAVRGGWRYVSPRRSTRWGTGTP